MFSRRTIRGLLRADVCPILILAGLTLSLAGAESSLPPAAPPETAAAAPAENAAAPAENAAAVPPDSAAAAPASPGDAAAKQQILESPAWNAALARLRAWLSVQVAYPPEEVPELQQRFEQRVAAMTADELQQFLSELDAKLDVLSSPEGVQARLWAKQYLTLLSDSRAAEFRQQIPDIVNMTAAQMQDAFAVIQQVQADRAARAQRFDSFRAAEVQAANARAQAQAQAAAAARAAAPRGGNMHPGFSPSSLAPRAPVQRFPGFGAGTWNRGVWW